MHVAGPGGSPGVVQSQLIELAISDAHQLALFADRVSTDGRLSPRERREESAARSRYERTLARLGMTPAAASSDRGRQRRSSRPNQWRFHVVPAKRLPASKTIGLVRVALLSDAVPWIGLSEAVESARAEL